MVEDGRSPMDEAGIRTGLSGLPEWELVDGKLHRVLTFDSFVKAFGFMTAVAFEAEQADHHPEWFNAYNRVEVWLTTHAAGGITERDFDLAAAIDRHADR